MESGETREKVLKRKIELLGTLKQILSESKL